MATPILAITDGTTRIELLARKSGLSLRDWSPGRAEVKQVRTSSPLAHGSQPAFTRYENITDTFTVVASQSNEDLLIQTCQDVDRLLVKAREYWETSWTTAPVWIEARAPEETNTRYATIVDYRISGESNPYSQPFFNAFCGAHYASLIVAIEHCLWQETPPGTGTAIPLTTQQVYNGVTYGRAYGAAGLDEHFVVNKQNLANITHIFRNRGAVWSGNLIGAALPYNLIEAAGAATGDITYFGCQSTLNESGPFNNLAFDIATAAVYVGASTYLPYYWNGAWVALTMYDDTAAAASQPWSRTGIRSMHWRQPSDWTTTAINGITAYWIRFVATVGGGGSISTATQQNRNVYTCVWPGILVQDTDIGGDIFSLARCQIHVRSDYTVPIPGYINRVMIGLRSTFRGADFTPYLNFSDDTLYGQNNAEIIANPGSANTTFQNELEAPSGRALRYSVAGLSAMQLEAYIGIGSGLATSTFAQQYVGRYLLFLRCRQTSGAATDLGVRIRIESDDVSSYWESAILRPQASNSWEALNFGQVVLPQMPTQAGLARMFIRVYIENTVAAARILWLYDVILFPIDEWFGDFREQLTGITTGAPMNVYRYLNVDSISQPKVPITATVHSLAATFVGVSRKSYFVDTIMPIGLQSNKDQRLWFFFQHSTDGSYIGPRYAPPHLMASVSFWKSQRYLGLRGTR